MYVIIEGTNDYNYIENILDYLVFTTKEEAQKYLDDYISKKEDLSDMFERVDDGGYFDGYGDCYYVGMLTIFNSNSEV